MFSTSADILNLVLAISIALLTFFLCWAIYYFIVSVQRINRISKKVESGVIKIEELIIMVKDKLRHGSAYFIVLSEIAKKAMEFIQERKMTSREKTEKNKTKKK